MFTKNRLFLSCLAVVVSIAAIANAQTVDVIRAEDEALLKGVVVSEDEPEQPVVVEKRSDIKKNYQAENVSSVDVERQTLETEKKKWFNPAELPTNMKRAEEQENDTLKKEYRQEINACMDDIKERLYMERELFESGVRNGIAYLSQTMAEINLCYENLGREIIEKYYGNDRTMKRDFSKKAETFYVNGTDVNFGSEFCGENCSMSNVLDAQLKKFGDFRIYLYKLLDDIPEGR